MIRLCVNCPGGQVPRAVMGRGSGFPTEKESWCLWGGQNGNEQEMGNPGFCWEERLVGILGRCCPVQLLTVSSVREEETRLWAFLCGGRQSGTTWDFSGDPVLKNLPANAEDMGSIPGPGRPHVPGGQLSLCPTPTEPACFTTKAPSSQWKPTHHNEEWSLNAATRESPSAATRTQHSKK